jgi:hypothetical protein
MRINWQAVVIVGLLTAGAVAAAYLGQEDLGMVLGGTVLGTLLPSPVGPSRAV